MTRRFPVVYQQHLGFDSTPTAFLLGFGSLLIIGSIIAKSYTADNKIENTKRHHPKGVGYTAINHQMDKLRDNAFRVFPKLDEHYWEYSRQRKRHVKK